MPSSWPCDIRTIVTAMRWLVAPMLLWGCSVLSGCSSESRPAAATGLDIAVRFGSNVPLATLQFDVRWVDQRVDVQQAVPPYVGPPQVRRLVTGVDLPDAAAGEVAQVRILGRSAAGEDLLEARTSTVVVAGARLVVQADLVPIDVCGDGVARLDACDDGNLIDGDGCSSTCEIEVIARTWTTSRQWPELSAESAEFVEVASFNLDPDPADRMVFFSGMLAGDDAAVVDAQIRVDGEVVDILGHQVFGEPADSGAGFFTFETIGSSTVARTVAIELRATAGIGLLRDLRAVAVQLPPGAGLLSSRRDDDIEQLGRDLTLESLLAPAGGAGRYLVWAKASLAESPGDGTARAWLELPGGVRQPADDQNATFSSPRASLNPMFTLAVVDVPAEGATFRLQGQSSGSVNNQIQAWALPASVFRHSVEIAGPTPADYAVRVVFDHAAQVAAGNAAANGSDVIVAYRPADTTQPVVRIDRVLDPDSGWNRPDTTLWIKTQAAIADTGSSGEYAVYFGGPSDIRDDPAQVFIAFDDFEAGVLDDRWQVVEDAGVTVDAGRLQVEGAAALATVASGPIGVRWEARVRMLVDAPNGLTYLAAGQLDEMGAPTGALFEAVNDAHQGRTETNEAVLAVATPQEWHTYTIVRPDADNVLFLQDGTELASVVGQTEPDQTWRLAIVNTGPSGAEYEWIRVRPYLATEPAVTVSELQGFSGVFPSTFRFRKLAAVRADAWTNVRVADAGETVRTDGPYTVAATLTLGPTTAERLVLQSVRVAGASDAAARRRGEARINDRVLVSTGHRIDRDATDQNGYHHIAGLAYAATASVSQTYEVGISSPDGINVNGADARIVVLDFPE